MGKTLKIYSYRGINVYIRSLGGLWYEALWIWNGGILCHQLQLLKNVKSQRRNSLEERNEGAIAELQFIVIAKLDSLFESRSIQSKIKKLYGKITTFIFGSAGESGSVSGQE